MYEEKRQELGRSHCLLQGQVMITNRKEGIMMGDEKSDFFIVL
jgi:hypothetical protein